MVVKVVELIVEILHDQFAICRYVNRQIAPFIACPRVGRRGYTIWEGGGGGGGGGGLDNC